MAASGITADELEAALLTAVTILADRLRLS